MDYWQVDALLVLLPALLLLRGTRPGREQRAAVAVLAVVALTWTAPWDEHLVSTGVWSYGDGRVLLTVGSVPVEEYAFVVLLVLLVAAWGLRTGLLAPAQPAPRGSRARGAAAWLAVAALGAGLVAAGGHVRYAGLLLAWAAVPLALQHGVAGDLLGGRRRTRALLAGPVVLWLCAVDRLALADGVWTVAEASSTGLLLLGLPVEEAAFFALATLLVADGLLLALDPRARARARALVPWRRRAQPASASPSAAAPTHSTRVSGT